MKPTASVLANSLPRGGPFLLASALQLLGYRKYARAEHNHTPAAFNYQEAQKALHGRQISAGENTIGISPFAPCHVEQARMHKWLQVMADNEYIPAHIPWSPALPIALERVNCRHIVIIRDPRTLLLSLLFDTHPMPRFLIEPFANMTPEEQLAFMLSGGEVPKASMTLQPFDTVYRSMLAWQNTPSCLVVRFEDLAGLHGGGTREQQWQTLQDMATFLDVPLNTSVADQLETITDPSVSTFRLDQAQQWRNTVSSQIIDLAMNRCEDLAREAKYKEIDTGT